MNDTKITNKNIVIPKGKIYSEFIEVNPESNYLLVFLHEGLGSTGQWKDFPELLCRMTGFNGFIYDRFGYGKSDKFNGNRNISYMQDEAYSYLPEILSAGNFNGKKIILTGHSDGGTIGLLYASKQPANLKCLISIAAHTFIEDISIEGIKNAVENYKNGDLKERLRKYHGDKTEKIFNDWSELWLDENSRKWNMLEELRNIKCPVLLIQGDNDEYGSESQVDTIINGVSGFTKKEIIYNCGHLPHVQARDYTAAVIIKFLYEIGLDFETRK
ncbi:MAG: alpha/beta hydrolase [Ignavibacteria bacterium]|nr:alpha/beta hydrolase [Ignavibacteria bacterium]